MESKQQEQKPSTDRKQELSPERMVELLNQDLAREYQAIIAYVVYSQTMKGAEYNAIAKELKKHAGEELDHALKIARQIDHLGGTPTVVPRPVEMSADPKKMLRFDLHNERETIANYRERIRQADEMGEFALGEVLRTIIAQEQEHEADLCDALGIAVPSLPEPAAR
jgi:bacterioferritin